MRAALDLDRVRRAIVVAPHPDDETIGAFGLIRRLIKSGAYVSVVIVTDGAASHPASPSWPSERLKMARRRESVAALRLCGLPQGALTFLDYPDGALSSLSETECRRLCRRLAARPFPDLVIRPSLEDSHPDHKAVASACVQAWPAKVFQATYSVWPAGQLRPAALRYPLGADQFIKQAALRMYRTQTGLITDDPDGFCIDRNLMRSFARLSESFGKND